MNAPELQGATDRPGVGPILLMGVAGSGKSTLGARLAARSGLAFLDADDLHDEAARARMGGGEGLDEATRAAWLDRVLARLARMPAPALLACSALKAVHRARLAPLLTVFLDIPQAAARTRLAARTGHFAGPRLCDSQFADLEAPAEAVRLDATRAPDDLTEAALAAIRAAGAPVRPPAP